MLLYIVPVSLSVVKKLIMLQYSLAIWLYCTIFSIILLWYFMTTCGSVFIAFLISRYIMNLVSIHNRIIRHIHTNILLTYVCRWYATYQLHIKSWKVTCPFVCLSTVFLNNSVVIEICIKMGLAQKAAFLGL